MAKAFLAPGAVDCSEDLVRANAIVAVGTSIVTSVAAHFFEHARSIHLMPSALEDLLIGWPMAAVLASIGGIVYGT